MDASKRKETTITITTTITTTTRRRKRRKIKDSYYSTCWKRFLTDCSSSTDFGSLETTLAKPHNQSHPGSFIYNINTTTRK